MDEENDPIQPTTAEIMAEVERRRSAARRPISEGQRRVILLADRFILWLSRRWLSVFNAAALIYVGLPILAPVLMVLGAPGPARVIYAMYAPLCHQLPKRSFFLFGPQLAYTMEELVDRVGLSQLVSEWSGGFTGNEAVGYKMALCQRDVAIYGMILLAGLAYGLLRRRWNVRPLPVWAYVLFGLVPLMLDGGYQMLSSLIGIYLPMLSLPPYESSPVTRVLTGALFGLATIWLAYPYVQETMDEVRQNLDGRLGGSDTDRG